MLGNLDLESIGNRLRRLDKFLAMLMKTRIAEGGLSDAVAEFKRNNSPDGIFPKKRAEVEHERIELMKKWSKEFGIDENVASSIMTTLILESCRVQDEYMWRQHQSGSKIMNSNDPDEIFKKQRENLLALTKKVAPEYDEKYGQTFFATRAYLEFEKHAMLNLVKSLEERSLAVDLGCATGIVSRRLWSHFDKVLGVDICPYMLREARGKLLPCTNNVRFENWDLENGLSLDSGSASFVVMNLGTASEIKNIQQVIIDMHRVLRPGGGFFLSFYNSESLRMKLGFLPWPMQLAAYVDPSKECLEVNFKREVYSLFAGAMNKNEVEKLLVNFDIKNIFSYPTLATVLPNIILGNENKKGEITENKEAQNIIRHIDIMLSGADFFPGTYLIVTGIKPKG